MHYFSIPRYEQDKNSYTQMAHIQVPNQTEMSIISFVVHKFCWFFRLMYVATIQCLNYTGPKTKNKFEVYISDIHTTLKQGQGHQT